MPIIIRCLYCDRELILPINLEEQAPNYYLVYNSILIEESNKCICQKGEDN